MTWPADLQALDERLLLMAHGHPAALLPIFYFATVVGGGWGLCALVPFAIQKRTRAVTLRLFAALAVTSAWVTLLKWLVARVRPCDALGWCAPIAVASPGGGSFPSGHAAGSFAFAAFIALRAPRWAVPATAWATLVAWSRCALGVHYPTDVLAGAILGLVVGVLFARASRRADPTSAPA